MLRRHKARRGPQQDIREASARRPNRPARTHIVILDGTMSSLTEGFETHAGQLFKLLSEAGDTQSIYYEPGLQWSDWRATLDVATGRGLSKQITRAYGHLASRYQPGDQIFFFGYSRGAYAVRSLAGMIDQIGLLEARHATERNVQMAFRHYRCTPESRAADAFRAAFCRHDVCIEMVGVWDTVKALGMRLPVLWHFSKTRHAFHNHELGNSIRHGFHALAFHERRNAYAPVLWTVPDGHHSHVEQLWFPGNHGDVGGQICGCNQARPLANLSLVWMLSKAEMCGLALPKGWRGRFEVNADAPSMGNWTGWAKLFWMRGKRRVLRDRTEALHPSLAREARGARRWFGARDNLPHKES